jgi:hypothetical protein
MNGYLSIESAAYSGPKPLSGTWRVMQAIQTIVGMGPGQPPGQALAEHRRYFPKFQGPPHPTGAPLPPGLVCSARLP